MQFLISRRILNNINWQRLHSKLHATSEKITKRHLLYIRDEFETVSHITKTKQNEINILVLTRIT